MLTLFPDLPATAFVIEKGAEFSACGLYRFVLWRIWDRSKPLVMFIGLNPSKADSKDDDPTIKSVTRITKHNGYGGFYMMNCWAYISTDPEGLIMDNVQENNAWLQKVRHWCKDVVFAWGNFAIVEKQKRNSFLQAMFSNAKCISKNANGSPGHPLFKKGNSVLQEW